jgi:hypothetical protein
VLDGRHEVTHAAALALVGWYLMLPPLRPEGPKTDPNTHYEADLSAPFSQWSAISPGKPFATKEECEAYRPHLMKLVNAPSNRAPSMP